MEISWWKRILQLKRCWLLTALPLGVLLEAVAMENRNFAEWYATSFYPGLSKAGNFISGLLPFSLGEWVVVFSVIAVVAFLVFQTIQLIRKRGDRLFCTARLFLNLFCAAGIVLLAFALSCGINYHRISFAESSGLEVRESSMEELTGLCEALAGEVNTLRPQITEVNGVATPPVSFSEMGQEAQEAFSTLSQQYPLLKDGYGVPKTVILSRGMSWMNITGIFFPFTFEANVNIDIPKYNIPAVMCHELSHLRGFMREDEANFLAYLACKNSDSLDFQYSGYMLAFIYATNALYEVDREGYSRIFNRLEPGVRRDISSQSDYWKQFEGPVADTATSINNSYLQVNQQDDGVKSYGRMVDLLLAEQRLGE